MLENACQGCGGTGYIVGEDESHAVARPCSCLPPCPHCEGKRFFVEKDGPYSFLKPCSCSAFHRRLSLFNEARIPNRFVSATLDTFGPFHESQGVAREAVQSFLKQYPAVKKGLLFIGPDGSGKTHLLVAMVRYLSLEKGIPCAFFHFPQLLSEIKLLYDQGESDLSFMDHLSSVEVLALDDLGCERGGSEWAAAILEEIVSARYMKCRATLCATPFPDEESSRKQPRKKLPLSPSHANTLEERTSRGVVSKLREMCQFLPLFPGKEWKLSS